MSPDSARRSRSLGQRVLGATLLSFPVLAFCVSPALARQTTLFEVGGDQLDDGLGRSVCGAGDLNADGFGDFLAASAYSNRNGTNSGMAVAYSGVDSSVLYLFLGDNTGDHLGGATSGAGDVNGDGHADFIVAVPYDDITLGMSTYVNAGSVRVCSGSDGGTLYSYKGLANSRLLGFAVDGGWDVDNDGFCDFVLGSTSGVAQVKSGASGTSILLLFDPSGSDPSWGVAMIGDADGDGHADIAGSDWGFQYGKGKVLLWSGQDGSKLYDVAGQTQLQYLGASIAAGGDLNHDGYRDLLIGVPSYSYGYGTIQVHSGNGGAVLSTIQETNTNLGHSVGGGYDVNNDGHDDIISGSVGVPDDGKIWVYSGVDHSLLFDLDGASNGMETLGESVALAGDVDNDGFAEAIVGAPGTSYLANDGGKVLVLSGDECGAIRSIVEGCDQSGSGAPDLTLHGCFLGGQPAVVSIDNGPANASAAILSSIAVGNVTLANGCVLGTGFPLGITLIGTLSGEGDWSAPTTIPQTAGITVYLAALMKDGGNTHLSNTLELEILP